MIPVPVLATLLYVSAGLCSRHPEPYYGRLIGKLQTFAHGIKGVAYAVDESTIFIKGFSYDGTGPDAFFWIGNSPKPSPEGIIIPYPEDYVGSGFTELRMSPATLSLANRIRSACTPLPPSIIPATRVSVVVSFKLFNYSGVGDCRRRQTKFCKAAIRERVRGILPYIFQIRDPPVLGAYNNTDIILRLPMGKRIKDIGWLSIWCRRFTVDFGEVMIPPRLEVPKPRILPEFKRLAHGLRSDNISILDAKTFYIPNLHYDGAGPDAYFWVGNGSEPTPFGIKVPNEMGSLDPLRGYQGEDIEIQLPGSLTVYDIDWLAVWCVQYRHNFGHVLIPKDLDVPPALGQTKISTSTSHRPSTPSNCREFLDKRLQVRWELKGDQLEVTLSGRIRESQYMAFGLSGQADRAEMVGGDVTVAFYDTDSRNFRAVDYYMSQRSQCDGKQGVCPDERIGGRNDVTLISGDRKDGVTTITYTKPLQTNEAVNDRSIPVNNKVSVIAAFGPINANKEANSHSFSDVTNKDYKINFSDLHDNDCSVSLNDLIDENAPKPWPQAQIINENNLTARIGPTGGKRGYTPITGLPSWGIAWYINDMLIPEITVERGQTYLITVEGGEDSARTARYHPFYITDSWYGGFGQKNESEQRKERVYAGVAYNNEGYPYPTAAGRYCEWTHKSIDKSNETETFQKFLATLRLECENGDPAYLNWTVPMDAPDELYYQCYIHRHMGWKIRVVDPGYISRQNGDGNSAHTNSMSFIAIAAVCLLTISAMTIHFRGRIL